MKVYMTASLKSRQELGTNEALLKKFDSFPKKLIHLLPQIIPNEPYVEIEVIKRNRTTGFSIVRVELLHKNNRLPELKKRKDRYEGPNPIPAPALF